MATYKFSSFLLLVLIVSTLSLLSMISGQMIPCLPGVCADTTSCHVACISQAYKGGACVLMDFSSTTGSCCCNPNIISQDSFKYSDTSVPIIN
ncbi:putative defensin-like protein 83 [Capsella rubella]|uniref:putative defensin-like protein 83 n=1 Tax=Capsella rubella TaxID=81985 RepID=UPI000CD4DC9A|nr:putative defensin-like protein 83 [Capsella rubella]